MKIFKRLSAATGVVALLVSGLVAVAAPAQAEHRYGDHEYGSVAGQPNLKETAESVNHPEFADAYACTKTSTDGKGTALDKAREQGCDPDYVNPLADTDGVRMFTWLRPNTSYYYDWTNYAYKLAPPKDRCEAAGGWWSDDDDYCLVLGDPAVRYEVLTDPPTGARWTGEVVCFESGSEPVIGNWADAFVLECDVVRAGRSGDPNAWAEYVVDEPVEEFTPPPPCWDASINNCPVGGALRFAAPEYAMVGVPVTMYAYASWRPDANSPAQPTDGTAVIRVDGEDYSGVEFVDGVAEWRFIPETEGMKEFTASGVLFSGLSGANAYIDTVPARTYVLEYDPAAYATALKKKAVEVGDTYVITDPNQARSYAEGRYEWSVSEKSEDVCAVYETKKGAVKAKFTDSGKCTVIWLDKESEESGKYTFIAKK